MFYTIQNNSILTAENEQSLSRFYDNVKKLPDDYQVNKYIVENGALILNPNWEQIEIENKQKTVREVRNKYLETYVDPKQLVIRWGTLTEQEQTDLVNYRQYLLDYTKEENWWEYPPLTFEEWKNPPITEENENATAVPVDNI